MNTTEGGSLLIAWQLKNKNVVIVGGGKVAAQRIASILTTDGHITVICPSDELSKYTQNYIDSYPRRITHRDRLFTGPSELTNADMVLTALDDPELSRAIWKLCRRHGIPINCADMPEICDFYFGAQIHDGPLQIMISTNGTGPRVAGLVRDKIKKALSGKEGKAIEKVGRLRTLLKERAPGMEDRVGERRMKWMSRVCETWSLEDFVALDEAMLHELLDEGWEKDRVPMPAELNKTFYLPRLSMTLGVVVGVAYVLGIVWSRQRGS